MTQVRHVRVCPVCTETNSSYATACRICGDSLDDVRPRLVSERGRRPLGIPERAIVGCGVGVLIGVLLQPYAPLLALVQPAIGLLVGDNMELREVFVPLTRQWVMLVMVCGMGAGTLLALTAFARGARPEDFALAPGRRWPCPFCSEMIQARATVCRYCDRTISIPGRTSWLPAGAPHSSA